LRAPGADGVGSTKKLSLYFGMAARLNEVRHDLKRAEWSLRYRKDVRWF
jgi:hypothetical protein